MRSYYIRAVGSKITSELLPTEYNAAIAAVHALQRSHPPPEPSNGGGGIIGYEGGISVQLTRREYATALNAIVAVQRGQGHTVPGAETSAAPPKPAASNTTLLAVAAAGAGTGFLVAGPPGAAVGALAGFLLGKKL